MARLLAVGFIAAVMLAACGKSGTDTRDAISRHLGSTQEHVKFKLVLPSYLPPGTRERPSAIIEDEGRRITIRFFGNQSAMAPLHQTATIQVIETFAPGATPGTDIDLGGTIIRRPNPRLEKTVVRGNEVAIVRQPESEQVVFISMHTAIDQVGIEVTVDWTNPAPEGRIRLTHEMEREAFKVFESMFD
jgi:hypothetical protein